MFFGLKDIDVSSIDIDIRMDLIIRKIMESVGNPGDATEISQRLANMDWYQHFLECHQHITSIVDMRLKEGCGWCDNCHELSMSPLIHAPFAPYVNDMTIWDTKEAPSILTKGRVCENCLVDLQKYYIKDGYGKELFRRCDNCHKLIQTKFLIRDHSVIKSNRFGHCNECIIKLENKLRITCTVCGSITMDHAVPDVCDDCNKKYPFSSLIRSHNRRASDLGLPATLNVKQWLGAIDHFHKKCAYCQKKDYSDMEHYLPISQGGGTTVDNCLPSCGRCNARKNDKSPDQLSGLFPSENLERIAAYFDSVKVA